MIPLWLFLLALFGGLIVIGISVWGGLGKTKSMPLSLLGIVLVIGGLFFAGMGQVDFKGLGGTSAFSVSPSGASPQAQITGASFDSTGYNAQFASQCNQAGGGTAMTLVLNQHGEGNTTGDETFDAAGTIYKITPNGETFHSAVTDTTAGNPATQPPCGYTFVYKQRAAAGDEGDSSRLISLRSPSGDPDVFIDENNNLRFASKYPSLRIDFGSYQHAALEVNGFDVTGNGWMHNDGDTTGAANGNDFEADGSIFTSATNATNISIGSGGSASTYYLLRSTREDTDFNDRGTCLGMDYNTQIFDDPGILINSQSYPDVKGNLNSDENREYGGTWDNVYCFDVPIRDGNNERLRIDVEFKALSGQNPTVAHNTNFTVVSKAQFLGIDGTTTKIALVDDTTNTNAIFAPFSFTQGFS